MTVESDDGRRFSQEDISPILKRAAKLQGALDSDTPISFSLAELQNIAADAGIDPRHVVTAAAEHSLSGTDSGRRETLLTHTAELVVDGEIDDVGWEAIVAEVRRTLGDTGVVTSWGRTNEWTHSGASGVQAHVTATSFDGRTHIRAYWQEGVLAAAVFIPFSVLSIILLPLLFDSLAMTTPSGIALYVVLVGALLFLARWILGRWALKHKASLSDLMTRIASIAEMAGSRIDAVPGIAVGERRDEVRPRLDASSLNVDGSDLPPGSSDAARRGRSQT